MKKIISLIIMLITLIMINIPVLAMSHISTSTATRTAIMTTMMASSISRRNRGSINTVDEVLEYIFNETQNESLKNYILENKQYLYLNSEDKAKEIINKYKESNLEETKQFIKDNYYNENKPKMEKTITIIFIVMIAIILIGGIVAIITV